MPSPRPLIAVLLGLALIGCASKPRVPATPYEEAGRDRTKREVVVVKVWDMVDQPLATDRHVFVSHYIEVDVVGGPDRGKRMTLPYDSYRHGNKPPPGPGTRLVVAPSDWVARDRRGSNDGYPWK
jgi:hypothetical protein